MWNGDHRKEVDTLEFSSLSMDKAVKNYVQST